MSSQAPDKFDDDDQLLEAQHTEDEFSGECFVTWEQGLQEIDNFIFWDPRDDKLRDLTILPAEPEATRVSGDSSHTDSDVRESSQISKGITIAKTRIADSPKPPRASTDRPGTTHHSESFEKRSQPLTPILERKGATCATPASPPWIPDPPLPQTCVSTLTPAPTPAAQHANIHKDEEASYNQKGAIVANSSPRSRSDDGVHTPPQLPKDNQHMPTPPKIDTVSMSELEVAVKSQFKNDVHAHTTPSTEGWQTQLQAAAGSRPHSEGCNPTLPQTEVTNNDSGPTDGVIVRIESPAPSTPWTTEIYELFMLTPQPVDTPAMDSPGDIIAHESESADSLQSRARDGMDPPDEPVGDAVSLEQPVDDARQDDGQNKVPQCETACGPLFQHGGQPEEPTTAVALPVSSSRGESVVEKNEDRGSELIDTFTALVPEESPEVPGEVGPGEQSVHGFMSANSKDGPAIPSAVLQETQAGDESHLPSLLILPSTLAVEKPPVTRDAIEECSQVPTDPHVTDDVEAAVTPHTTIPTLHTKWQEVEPAMTENELGSIYDSLLSQLGETTDAIKEREAAEASSNRQAASPMPESLVISSAADLEAAATAGEDYLLCTTAEAIEPLVEPVEQTQPILDGTEIQKETTPTSPLDTVAEVIAPGTFSTVTADIPSPEAVSTDQDCVDSLSAIRTPADVIEEDTSAHTLVETAKDPEHEDDISGDKRTLNTVAVLDDDTVSPSADEGSLPSIDPGTNLCNNPAAAAADTDAELSHEESPARSDEVDKAKETVTEHLSKDDAAYQTTEQVPSATADEQSPSTPPVSSESNSELPQPALETAADLQPPQIQEVPENQDCYGEERLHQDVGEDVSAAETMHEQMSNSPATNCKSTSENDTFVLTNASVSGEYDVEQPHAKSETASSTALEASIETRQMEVAVTHNLITPAPNEKEEDNKTDAIKADAIKAVQSPPWKPKSTQSQKRTKSDLPSDDTSNSADEAPAKKKHKKTAAVQSLKDGETQPQESKAGDESPNSLYDPPPPSPDTYTTEGEDATAQISPQFARWMFYPKTLEPANTSSHTSEASMHEVSVGSPASFASPARGSPPPAPKSDGEGATSPAPTSPLASIPAEEDSHFSDIEDETVIEETVQGDVAEDEVVQDKAVKERVVKEHVIDDPAAVDSAAEDEIVEDELAMNRTAEDHTAEDQTPGDRVLESEAVEDEVIEDRTAEDQIVEDQAIEDPAIEHEATKLVEQVITPAPPPPTEKTKKKREPYTKVPMTARELANLSDNTPRWEKQTLRKKAAATAAATAQHEEQDVEEEDPSGETAVEKQAEVDTPRRLKLKLKLPPASTIATSSLAQTPNNKAPATDANPQTPPQQTTISASVPHTPSKPTTTTTAKPAPGSVGLTTPHPFYPGYNKRHTRSDTRSENQNSSSAAGSTAPVDELLVHHRNSAAPGGSEANAEDEDVREANADDDEDGDGEYIAPAPKTKKKAGTTASVKAATAKKRPASPVQHTSNPPSKAVKTNKYGFRERVSSRRAASATPTTTAASKTASSSSAAKPSKLRTTATAAMAQESVVKGTTPAKSTAVKKKLSPPQKRQTRRASAVAEEQERVEKEQERVEIEKERGEREREREERREKGRVDKGLRRR